MVVSRNAKAAIWGPPRGAHSTAMMSAPMISMSMLRYGAIAEASTSTQAREAEWTVSEISEMGVIVPTRR